MNEIEHCGDEHFVLEERAVEPARLDGRGEVQEGGSITEVSYFTSKKQGETRFKGSTMPLQIMRPYDAAVTLSSFLKNRLSGRFSSLHL